MKLTLKFLAVGMLKGGHFLGFYPGILSLSLQLQVPAALGDGRAI